MELPPTSTGISVVHEGLLRATLNDIGWYAKTYNLTPDQVREVFDTGLVAVARDRRLGFAHLIQKSSPNDNAVSCRPRASCRSVLR
jgi:hypothetical protein